MFKKCKKKNEYKKCLFWHYIYMNTFGGVIILNLQGYKLPRIFPNITQYFSYFYIYFITYIYHSNICATVITEFHYNP